MLRTPSSAERIRPTDLDLRGARELPARLDDLSLEDVEALMIKKALSRHGNVTEAARRLNVSGNTVRTHLRHLMEKLGVNSQLAAAARARELAEAVDASRVTATAPSPLTLDIRDVVESQCTSS